MDLSALFRDDERAALTRLKEIYKERLLNIDKRIMEIDGK